MHRQSCGTASRALIMLCAVVLGGCASVSGDWERARKSDQTFAYEAFLRKHPDSEFASQARARLAEIKWNLARRDDKLETLDKFVTDNPTSPFRGQAEQRIAELHRQQYDTVRAKATADAYEEYLKKYPKGPHAASATGELDELMWADATRLATLGAHKAYRTRFPAGRHAEEANRTIAPLKAAALAAEGWAGGEASPSCRWICEAKACVDDIDKALWLRLSETLGKIRGAGTAFSFTQDPSYTCNAVSSRGESTVAWSNCVDRRSGQRATYESRTGEAELLSVTRLAPAAITRWQRSCD